MKRLYNRNLTLLFTTRIIRLFCYGFLSVVLALYLSETGLTEEQIGLLFTLTLAGDAAISLWLTTSADRFGRRRTLFIGALLVFGAGLAFIFTRNVIVLIAAAIVGVISPSGNEIGPFLSVEQAGLTQLIPDKKRTQVFAWYNLVGSFATAIGALTGGWLAQALQVNGWTEIESHRVVLVGYAIGGLLLAILFLSLTRDVEVPASSQAESTRRVLGLHKSRRVVAKLSALFALDAFAGGLIIQSMIAYWFHVRFGIESGMLGNIFFGANLLAGISALLAVKIARRIGLINTMVFTHIPSNILLMLVPLMPSLPLAIGLLLLRFSISQMDVPTRQSYTMAVVSPDERSAASGVTAIARSVGASLSPALTGLFLGIPALFNVPFFLSGGLKIVYDLLLFREFRMVRPPGGKQTMNVQDYLSRIGYAGTIRPDLETLRRLQRAHMLRVPFENLDIVPLGKPIHLDEASLWDKIVVRKRGGFCYELNGMFAWLLKQIGFEVTYLDAVTYYPETDSFGIDFDHLTLMVRIPNQSTRWLADVGYGDNFTVPMNIDDPYKQVEGLREYQLEPFKDGYQLWRRNFDGTRQSQYYFDLTAHRFPSEYEATCRYHQTSPDSFFTKRRIISRLTEDGRVTLENQKMIVTKNGRKKEGPFNESNFASLLKEHFEIVL